MPYRPSQHASAHHGALLSPQVIQNRGYGIAADWWSLGVLLVQCLTLTTPFQDPQQRPQKTFDNILTNKVRSTALCRALPRLGVPRMTLDGRGWPRMASDDLGWPRMASDDCD